MQPKGQLRPYHTPLLNLQRLFETVGIIGALKISTLVRGAEFDSQYALLGITGAVLFLVFAELFGLYHSWRTKTILEECSSVFLTWALVLGLLIIGFFFLKSAEEFSRIVIVTWGLAVPCLLWLARACGRLWLKRLRIVGRNTRTAALAGLSPAADRMYRQINRSPWMGFRLLGVFDDRQTDVAPSPCRRAKRNYTSSHTPVHALPLNGTLNELVEKARSGEIEYIFITLPIYAEKRIMHLLDQLADTTAEVYVVPDFFLMELSHAHWSNLGNTPLISILQTPFHSVNGALKQIEDYILATCILLLISPILILIAIAVKLTSKGPVIFKQKRYGLNGQEILVWKFRSMTVCENDNSVKQATKNDSRITPIGAFLRKNSLDELPQFFNVLQGRMSIVGPRPHATAHNEQYRHLIHGYMMRHKVKPGITGWAQVNGYRGETDTLEKMEKRVDFDLHYVQNWSLSLDLKIIFLTIFKGFRGKNVY